MDNNGLDNKTELIMTLSEVASYLKVAEKTINRMIGRNEIPCAKIGGQWRFFRPMIDDWLVSRMRGGFPSAPSPAMDTQGDGWTGQDTFVCFDIEGGSKEEILRSLIVPLHDRLANPETFLTLLLERERMLSTAVGNGIAFPHVRNPRSNPKGGPCLVIGISRQGVPFESPDGKLVRLFALYCAQDETTHLRGLSRLSVILSGADVLGRILDARTAEEVVNAFRLDA